MRKLLSAVLFVLLALAIAPAGVQAAARTPGQELVLLKKKQAAEAQARRLAAQKASLARKRAAEARRKTVQRQDCGSFLECLFGKPRRGGRVSRASLGGDRETSEVVSWNESKYSAGSLIVRTPERALYLVLGGGKARRYSVGVGREGFQWSGRSRIASKQEWPTWRPPEEMIRREAEKGHILPEVMEGGPENPLGARALYIGGTLFRIHGTNNAASIGGAVSSGCIRMMNSDVIDLYERVRVGARVYVYQ